MKKIIIISTCLIFATAFVACGSSFAQRDVNTAQQAAKSAREKIAEQSDAGDVKIEVASVVNTDEPASNNVSVGEDGSIRIGYQDNRQKNKP